MLSPEALEGFRTYLLTVASRKLGSDLVAKVSASDLVQETLLAAGRDAGSFRGRGSDDLKPWLKGILLHHVANVRRHYRDTARRRVAIERPLASVRPDGPDREALADSATSACTLAVRVERRDAIAEALDCLPEPYRRVLLWRHRDELTHEQIGTRLGISADAARKLWGRAVLRLREVLGPAHDPD